MADLHPDRPVQPWPARAWAGHGTRPRPGPAPGAGPSEPRTRCAGASSARAGSPLGDAGLRRTSSTRYPVAVASRSQDRAQAFADEYRLERAYGSYAELMADDEVDALYIATPHPQHHAVAMAAIEAGKAVLVEKSFTATVAGAEEVVTAARERQVFVDGGDVDPVPAGHRHRPRADRRRRDRRGAAGPGRSRGRPSVRSDRPAVRPGPGRRGDARPRGLRRLVGAALPRHPGPRPGQRFAGPDRGGPGGRDPARLRRRPGGVAADLAAQPDAGVRPDPRHPGLDRGAAALPPPEEHRRCTGRATSRRLRPPAARDAATPTS